MESLQYFLIVYQCLGPPHYLSVFGANKMSTKRRIESTGQSPAGSAKNVSFVNNQPVTTTTDAATSPVVLKPPVVSIPLSCLTISQFCFKN